MLIVQVEAERMGVAPGALKGRAMQKPIPGVLSRHLPDAATAASKGVARASRGKAPNALIASTGVSSAASSSAKRRPATSQIFAMRCP